MAEMGICALCGSYKDLLKSHIVPKFTVDWLKRTSATGYLRDFLRPNVRKQDGPKQRLLCADCEGLFSIFENKFAERIWVPYQDELCDHFEYEEWLRLFAVSLAWRIGTINMEGFRLEHPGSTKLIRSMDEALSSWGAFLLNKSSNPGPYDHHMFFVNRVNVPNEVKPALPDNFLVYLRRSFDATIAGSPTSVSTYTKLPGIIFFSSIRPNKVLGWKGTRISRTGKIGTGQTLENKGMSNFVMKRTNFVGGIKVSPRQEAQINDSVMSNLERAFSSDTFQTYLLGQQLKE
jgi:hypothetical protein